MKTIKIFISQPMTGIDELEIAGTKYGAAEALRKHFDGVYKVEIVSSFVYNPIPEATESSVPNLWYLGRSLQMLAEADYICMCQGWENARGCLIEHEAAEKYGIKILYMDEDYDIHRINTYVPEEKEPSVDERILKELQDLKSVASEILIFLSLESTKLQDKATVSLGDIQRYDGYMENYIAKRKLVEETENENRQN